MGACLQHFDRIDIGPHREKIVQITAYIGWDWLECSILSPIDLQGYLLEDTTIDLDCSASDEDGDNITYSMVTKPSTNMTMDFSSGAIAWAYPSIGIYNVTIGATDGTIPIYYRFTIVVLGKHIETDPDDNDTGTGGNGTIPTDYPNSTTDTDEDGIPDWWEEFYGLDPNNSTDAAMDLDGNGTSALEEFLNKTNPISADTIPSTDGTDGTSNGGDPGPSIIPPPEKEDTATSSKKDDPMRVVMGIILLAVIAAIIVGVGVFLTMSKGKAAADVDDEPEEEEDPEDDEDLEEEIEEGEPKPKKSGKKGKKK